MHEWTHEYGMQTLFRADVTKNDYLSILYKGLDL